MIQCQAQNCHFTADGPNEEATMAAHVDFKHGYMTGTQSTVEDDEFAALLVDHGLNDDGTPWALIQGVEGLVDWRARLERYIHRPPETEFHDPIVIIDDPPPNGPRSAETDKLLHDWYKSHVTDAPWPPPDEIPDPAVRCATWLYPAVVAALTVGVVYLSYRAARR